MATFQKESSGGLEEEDTDRQSKSMAPKPKKVKKKKTPGYMQTTATANNKKVAGDESKSPSQAKKPKKEE